MSHKTEKKVLAAWHDAYYALTGHSGEEFAMRCRDVTAIVDLRDPPPTLSGKFRYRLHLTLCESCRNYYRLSNLLRSNLQQLIKKRAIEKSSLEEFNRALVDSIARRQPG